MRVALSENHITPLFVHYFSNFHYWLVPYLVLSKVVHVQKGLVEDMGLFAWLHRFSLDIWTFMEVIIFI